MTTPRTYKPSSKRETTARKTRERIRAGAWEVFSRHGLGRASIAEIVSASDISTGTFYNYYGTQEAVFQEILAEMLDRIRSITANARAKSDDLETMLLLSYEDLLDYILTLDGARAFIACNQHQIRSALYGLDGTEGVISDIKQDVVRGLPGLDPDSPEVELIARIVVSIALEAVIQLQGDGTVETQDIARMMASLVIGGIERVQNGKLETTLKFS
ncbi:TetR/AcrR family transcriptional regulator [Fluviibacterium sp. S390]|uniref:TetR/AcrR family transcriptional regulator n=1 Tax=Fluviibacterium sp. S390 TaxID=3415139 RepID=UPI003C7C4A06